ncbi:hypothetical protein KKA14_16230 [bacterium]|nr:hypothetical protein [bacterium]
MAIKVIITRRYSPELESLILPFLRELFTLIRQHGGYISGETLDCVEDTKEHLIISTWQSLKEWEVYNGSEEVNEIRNKIDSVIGEQTTRRVYKSRQYD